MTLDKSLNISELHFFSAEWNQPPSCRVSVRIKRNNIYEKTPKTRKCKTFWEGGLLIVWALSSSLSRQKPPHFPQPSGFWKYLTLSCFWTEVININGFNNFFWTEKWDMEWDYLITGGMWLTCVEAKFHLEIHDPPFLSHPTQNCEYTSRPF